MLDLSLSVSRDTVIENMLSEVATADERESSSKADGGGGGGDSEQLHRKPRGDTILGEFDLVKGRRSSEQQRPTSHSIPEDGRSGEGGGGVSSSAPTSDSEAEAEAEADSTASRNSTSNKRNKDRR